MLIYQFIYKFYNVFDRFYGKHNENTYRYYYDYDNIEIINEKTKYNMIVNDVDENEKLSVDYDTE
jgi:hypothetical protein